MKRQAHALKEWLKRTWPDWLNVTVGVWMMVSAFIPVFAGTPAGAWTSGVMGVAITLVSLAAVLRVEAWKEWTNLLFGAALAIAPWPLGLELWSHAFLNFVGDGLFLAAHAIYKLVYPPERREGA